jgi:hypothetical protein
MASGIWCQAFGIGIFAVDLKVFKLLFLFQEYWRIMVPRLLSPTHSCTSINQKHDEFKIKSQLLEPLNAFIAGTDDYADIYQVHMALNLEKLV